MINQDYINNTVRFIRDSVDSDPFLSQSLLIVINKEENYIGLKIQGDTKTFKIPINSDNIAKDINQNINNISKRFYTTSNKEKIVYYIN